jgi:hypothetical protein
MLYDMSSVMHHVWRALPHAERLARSSASAVTGEKITVTFDVI